MSGRSRTAFPALIYFACLASGAAGLIYQIVWMRKLSLIVGAASLAVSVVLGLFMGGLALGSWIFGRMADRSRAPEKLYAALEAGIAVLGALSLVLLEAGRFDSAGRLLRYALAGIAVLAPATLMGGTLPVLLRGICRGAERVGRDFGRLYSVNTLGAVLGALATTFLLVRSFGLRMSVGAACALNLAAAGAALLAARGATMRAPPAPAENARPLPCDRLLLAIFALSGFLGLAYEVLWTRYLILVLNSNSVYAFGMMLAAFLVGIVLGSALASEASERIKELRVPLGLALIGTGCAAVAAVAVMGWLIAHRSPAGGAFWDVQAGRLARSLCVLLPPTTLSGAVLPLAAKLYARSARTLGRDAGRLYAVNTFGAILGALAGGFVVLPALGLRGGIVLLAAANTAAGFAVLASIGRAGRAASSAGAAAVLLSLGIAAAAGDPSRWGGDPGKELLFYEDSAESTVSVTRAKATGELRLHVDWRDQAATGSRYQVHLRLLGHLPALLHPEPKRGLVVAFGAGVTAGSLAQHPLESLDIVELSPAVLRAAPLFAPYNHDPLSDSRVRVIPGDGRHHLATSRERYDVITVDPLNPEDAGISSLYSREFYGLVRARLRPGGVAAQWMPMHYRPEDYRMLVRTFTSVFPHSSLWYADMQTVLVGTLDGPRVSLGDLRRRFSDARVRESLETVGIPSAEALAPLLIGGPSDLRRLTGPGTLNTDDRPRVEYLRTHSLSSDATQNRAETWEILAGMRPPAWNEVFAGWNGADRRDVAPGSRALDHFFLRRLPKRRYPQPDAPVSEKVRIMEAFARVYLDATWEILAAPIPCVYRLIIGLEHEAPDGMTPEQRSAWGDALADWRGERFRKALGRFSRMERRVPGGVRAGLLAVACLDRLGRPLEALERALSLDFGGRLHAAEINSLPHWLVDSVLAEMERSPGSAARLGGGLAALIPPERNRPAAGKTADVGLWRRWWSRARFHLDAGKGRFRWKD